MFLLAITLIICYSADGIGTSDFGESLRFRKVLQGQEILGVNPPFDGINAQSPRLYDLGRYYLGPNCSGIPPTGNNIRMPHAASDFSCNGTGFSESFRFQKVLQGQEILPSQPYGRALSIERLELMVALDILMVISCLTPEMGGLYRCMTMLHICMHPLHLHKCHLHHLC